MSEQELAVEVVRDAEAAFARVASGAIRAVISEVELGASDGSALLNRLGRSGHEVPFLFLARRANRESVTRGIELGAVDYVVKPALPDVVVAKVKKALADDSRPAVANRGFSGSLAEMGLPDVVQILSNGRKSGRLSIRALGFSGDIAFRDGLIFEARFGDLEGAEAFYAMLLATDENFALDTTYVPARNVVQQSTEGLLLEGMRRLDERSR